MRLSRSIISPNVIDKTGAASATTSSVIARNNKASNKCVVSGGSSNGVKAHLSTWHDVAIFLPQKSSEV